MRRRDLLLLAGASAGLAGCTLIPESGPVVKVTQSAQPSSNPGVQPSVLPPSPGASIDDIVSGFLQAMTYSSNPAYDVAREFLTKNASRAWDTAAGVQIYEDNHRPAITADSATLSSPLVGELDRAGWFTPLNRTFTHDFGMVKERDQWRISRPPKGLLVSEFSFARYFRPLRLQFLSANGAVLVPEQVHVPSSANLISIAISSLLSGPSPWSRGAVRTMIPGDTKNASVSVDPRGVAEVSLSPQINALDNASRTALAAQVVWTLEQFDEVSGVRITVNGSPWQVPGAAGDGVLTPNLFSNFLPVKADEVGALLGVRQGVLGRITEADKDQFVPLDGPVGRGRQKYVPGQIDGSATLDLVAYVTVDRDLLLTAKTSSDPVVKFRAENLARPQLWSDNSVWSMGDVEGRRSLIRVPAMGPATVTPITSMPAGRIRAFRISPDRTRIAVVLDTGRTSMLGMLRLSGTDQLTVDGWRPMPVGGASNRLTQVVDVAWMGATTLIVLSKTVVDTITGAYWVQSDGSNVENVGPNLDQGQSQQVSAAPRQGNNAAVILSTDGSLWRFEARSRWTVVMPRLTAVAQT